MVKTPRSTAGGTSLIPGQGTEILHAMQRGQKKKNKARKKLNVLKKGRIEEKAPRILILSL